ncbi:MAG: type II toxin-antitoxin system VapC family toxin [Candidatus Pacebacteria bacterium]|nr:type II toxin-antitoxin system VapC family toxin [Candidatus Paceibacterota bacterium]PIR60653.1 MAG: hypothetical protein COU68_02370 [Candidatus Pacebacteria bacterium CG10_big_fil_rev_8_21_14_0_10_45_6]
MQKLFVDTNVIISYLTQRNLEQTLEIVKTFQEANENELQLFITSEVLLEASFVLKRYNLSRQEIAQKLLAVVKSPTFFVSEKDIFIGALELLKDINADLADCLLYVRSRKAGAGVYTFDKDFTKFD